MHGCCLKILDEFVKQAFNQRPKHRDENPRMQPELCPGLVMNSPVGESEIMLSPFNRSHFRENKSGMGSMKWRSNHRGG